MRRFWTVVCCWILCNGGTLCGQELGSETGSLAASVVRIPPLPGEMEPPVITALAIAPQGNWIAVAGDDHSIRVLDPVDGRNLASLIAHRDWIKSIAFSPGGRRLASCGHDGELRVWEFQPDEGTLHLLTEQRADHALFALAFATENELFAVGFSNAVYRLDMTENAWQVDQRCDCKDLRAVDVSRDGRWMAYGGRDGIIRLQCLLGSQHALASTGASAASSPSQISPHLHFERILAIRFSGDGKTVYSCGEDRRLVAWDPSANRAVASLDIQAGKLFALCPLEDGMVAVGGSDNTIRIVDIHRSKILAKFIGHDGSVATLERDAERLYSAGFDTTVRVWPIEESIRRTDGSGRFHHPISAHFEDSSSQEPIR